MNKEVVSTYFDNGNNFRRSRNIGNPDIPAGDKQ